MTDWVHQSIHEAIAAHRELRGRARMRRKFEEIYGPTRVYGPPPPRLDPPPPQAKCVGPVVVDLRVRALRPSRRHRGPDNPQRLSLRAQLRAEREARQAAWYDHLIMVQDGRCYMCRAEFCADLLPTDDHVWPIDRGGTNTRNILFACAPCNNRKGNRLPSEEEMETLRRVYQAIDELLSQPA